MRRSTAAVARLATLIVSCAALAASSAVAAPEAPLGAPTAPPVADRIIVEWEPGVPSVDRVAARADAETSFVRTLGDPTFQVVRPAAGQSLGDALGTLRADPAVRVAVRDGYSVPNATPNDPLFPQLWGLDNLGLGVNGFASPLAGADIAATAAWDRTRGVSTVVIADIDSGYRFDAPDLAPVAWTNPLDPPGGGDNDANGIIDDSHGADFVGNSAQSPSTDGDPTDDNIVSGGHGVHTAGTMGAAGNNGVGISGVAQDVRIMPLRVCANDASTNAAMCPFSSQILAINYAGSHGARAANMSLGGTSFNTAVRDAIASNPQTLFVISAGNDTQDNDSTPHYPCAYDPTTSGIGGAIDNIVCVAATDQADQLASFSDWGATSVDLGAPGTETLSTYPVKAVRLDDNFETDDFVGQWTPSPGATGGFARTNEAPLTSFGMSDSPGAAPVANTVRSSTSAGVTIPAGYGSCVLTQRRNLSVGGGDTFQYFVLSNGSPVFTSNFVSASGVVSTVPIPGLAGTTVQVRDTFTAGSSPDPAHGAWIDDVTISCYAPLATAPTYDYLDGTSMAAPHVTGAAGLLFSLKPSATVTEVRAALLAGVDPTPSLAGKTTTGGRLDVFAAMNALVPLGTQPPDTAISSGPAGFSSGTATFAFSRSDSAGPATFECRLDGASWSACASPAAYSGLAPGAHVFAVRAENGGSVDPHPATRMWTQLAPPDTGIASTPESTTTSTTASFAFARTDSVAAATFECQLDGGAFVACASPASYTVGVGGHAFQVRAKDAFGTVDATPSAFAWTVVAPPVVIPPVVIPPVVVPPVVVPPVVVPPVVVTCKVPALAGKTLTQASQALKRAHCNLGTVTKPKARKGHRLPPLVVASSSPKKGTVRAAGSKIKLTLKAKPTKKPAPHR